MPKKKEILTSKIHDYLLSFDILKSRLTKKKSPLLVTWALTYRCNQSCNYCYIKPRESNELSTKDALRLARELAKEGTRWLCLAGGEPLLRDDLKEIIGECKKNRIFISLSTNGCSRESIKQLKNAGLTQLDEIFISLDGDEKSHDSMRGQGTYKKVIENIPLAKQLGARIILMCVLTEANFNKIGFLVKAAEDFGVVVRFQPLRVKKGAIWNFSASPQQLKEAVDKIILLKKMGLPVGNSYNALNYFLRWPRLKHFKNCIAGRIFCYIMPDGYIKSCFDIEGKNEILRFPEYSLKEAFTHLRKSIKPVLACNGCIQNGISDINRIYGAK